MGPDGAPDVLAGAGAGSGAEPVATDEGGSSGGSDEGDTTWGSARAWAARARVARVMSSEFIMAV